MNFLEQLRLWPRAYGPSQVSAKYRQQPSDFGVKELIGFPLDNQGDHLCLLVRKTDLNSHSIIELLCSHFNVASVDIGYFGLKDKHAITEQWFSIHLPGKVREHLSTSSLTLDHDNVSVLDVSRHSKKFRIGSHRANRFTIVLRDVEGDIAFIESRIKLIFSEGFPNYFGEQRFGIGAGNLAKAVTLFKSMGSSAKGRSSRSRASRSQRSLYMSAARSFLFNEVLSARLTDGSWLKPMPDEKLILNGTRSFFQESPDDQRAENTVDQRLINLDIHTSGPLWGKIATADQISTWEDQALAQYGDLKLGLEHSGMKLERRALRAVASNTDWRWIDDNTLELSFELPAGTYATSLLRELFA